MTVLPLAGIDRYFELSFSQFSEETAWLFGQKRATNSSVEYASVIWISVSGSGFVKAIGVLIFCPTLTFV
jgi:hypothetical protein